MPHCCFVLSDAVVVVGAEPSTEAVSPPYAKRTRQGRGSSSSSSWRERSPEDFSIWAAENMYQFVIRFNRKFMLTEEAEDREDVRPISQHPTNRYPV